MSKQVAELEAHFGTALLHRTTRRLNATDAGRRWAGQWTSWENYDKFFSQMIRWAMRPVNEEGKFSIASDVKDGKVEDASRSALKQLVRTFFDNSTGSAMAALLDLSDAPLSESEHKRLTALLERGRAQGESR